MKTTPFTDMAWLFRGHIVKQWSLALQGSPFQVSASLTEAVVRFGYVTCFRPAPGTSFGEWALRPEKIPLWAAQAALRLMLESGWTPISSMEWCGIAALFFKANKQCSLNELLTKLPTSIDRLIAAGWLAAAVEEGAHYRSSRKIK